MDVDVSTDIIIDRPVHAVAEYASNPDHVPEWYSNITSVEWKTDKPVRVGSRIAFVARFLGRRMAYTYEVLALSSRGLLMRTVDGPFPMETSYTWRDVDASTQMTLRNRGTLKGLRRWIAPLIAKAVRRANRKDLDALKRVLETE